MLPVDDPWVSDLVKVYKKPAEVQRQEVGKELHKFVRVNRCLFLELRRFDQKRSVKKDPARAPEPQKERPWGRRRKRFGRALQFA